MRKMSNPLTRSIASSRMLEVDCSENKKKQLRSLNGATLLGRISERDNTNVQQQGDLTV